MTASDDTIGSSPSLVELASLVRSYFIKVEAKGAIPPSMQRLIVKAEEVAKIYFTNREKVTTVELDILYEVLREFGIIAAHVPQDFHTHVANVTKCLEAKDRTVTRSHVVGLIFSRM